MITEIIQVAEQNAYAIVIIGGFIIGLIKQNKNYKKAKAVITKVVIAWEDDVITEEEFNDIIAEIKKEY